MKIYKTCVSIVVLGSVVSGFYLYNYYFQKRSPFDSEAFYFVATVLDGDTFTVHKDSEIVTVRMLGINTPETVDPRRDVECYGPEASAETKRLLKGRQVRFELSPHREVKDKYGRYLAYVYLENGMLINEYLIENGFAKEYTYGSPYSMQKEFRNIEKEAENKQVGLWKMCVG